MKSQKRKILEKLYGDKIGQKEIHIDIDTYEKNAGKLPKFCNINNGSAIKTFATDNGYHLEIKKPEIILIKD